jgi:ATP-dependent protease HslVU (ClpYQ) ATPase subunit
MLRSGAMCFRRRYVGNDPYMHRVVIIGNSGSGKSYLARRLSEQLTLPLIHLDALFWEPGGVPISALEPD